MSTTQPPSILILGAGGHGRVVLDIIRQGGRFTPIGFLDNNPALHGRRIDGLPVLGGIDKLKELLEPAAEAPGVVEPANGRSGVATGNALQGVAPTIRRGSTSSVDPALDRCAVEPVSNRFAAVIAIGDNGVRRMIAETVEAAGIDLPPIIHPSAQIATNVTIGRGVVIAAGALVCAHSQIGDYAILNTGCIVDHESMIGTAVHVCPGVRLAGHVTLESGAFIGIGSTVIQNVRIGFEAIVGAGAVVTCDVDPMTTVVGVPARAIKDAPSADQFASLLKPTPKAAGDLWNRPMAGSEKGATESPIVEDPPRRAPLLNNSPGQPSKARIRGLTPMPALPPEPDTSETRLGGLTCSPAHLSDVDPRDPMYVSGR